jgi:mannan endo-1,4-beta-mannosidase
MVTVGDEGMRTNGSTAEPHSWLNNGYEGVDFECNLAAPDVDFGTVHAYPDQWGIPADDYTWMEENYFDDRAKIAKNYDKPLILEEYGMRREGYLPSREPLFQFFHTSANEADYACTLVWGVSHYSTDAGTSGKLFGYDDNQGYIFPYTSSESFSSNGAAAVLQQYQYMQGKVKKDFCIYLCTIYYFHNF